MADVELAIKIPEETYEYWKEHKHEYVLAEAIANGTPLPKGHGRLIDADRTINNGINKGFCDWYDEMKYADTVIEADKPGSEEYQMNETKFIISENQILSAVKHALELNIQEHRIVDILMHDIEGEIDTVLHNDCKEVRATSDNEIMTTELTLDNVEVAKEKLLAGSETELAGIVAVAVKAFDYLIELDSLASAEILKKAIKSLNDYRWNYGSDADVDVAIRIAIRHFRKILELKEAKGRDQC